MENVCACVSARRLLDIGVDGCLHWYVAQAAERVSLEQLDAQIEDDSGLDEPALEKLRAKRRQNVKKIADADNRLAVSASA